MDYDTMLKNKRIQLRWDEIDENIDTLKNEDGYDGRDFVLFRLYSQMLAVVDCEDESNRVTRFGELVTDLVKKAWQDGYKSGVKK